MKTKVLLLGTLAIALAACNNDENTTIDTGDGRALFSASIGAQTRAFDTSWEGDDQIGITGTTGTKTYTNVAYQTTNDDGNFTVATPGDEIYYQDDNAVNFTAYYPWNDLGTGVTEISADTWGQSDQKSFDFLHATATGSKAKPNVAFTFSHKMAKLVLTIKKGADVSLDEVKAAVLLLEGFKHEGTFNITDGTTATKDASTAGWEFANNSADPAYNAPFVVDTKNETVAYTLIFFPQTFASGLDFTAELTGIQTFSTTLDFTAANADAGDSEAKNEWVAGRQYNMSVTLHKTGITVTGCTISKWEEADGGNVDAE